MLAEAVGGWLTNSLALIADAGHMLTDVAALGLTLGAIWFAARSVSKPLADWNQLSKSWLLLHRAVKEGEMSLAQANKEKTKVKLAAGEPGDPETIKVLPEHIAKREDLRARFEREARAVASLNHPAIVQIYDIVEDDNGEIVPPRPGQVATRLLDVEEIVTQTRAALDALTQLVAQLSLQAPSEIGRAHV